MRNNKKFRSKKMLFFKFRISFQCSMFDKPLFSLIHKYFDKKLFFPLHCYLWIFFLIKWMNLLIFYIFIISLFFFFNKHFSSSKDNKYVLFVLISLIQSLFFLLFYSNEFIHKIFNPLKNNKRRYEQQKSFNKLKNSFILFINNIQNRFLLIFQKR